jgi:hypothetical protein
MHSITILITAFMALAAFTSAVTITITSTSTSTVVAIASPTPRPPTIAGHNFSRSCEDGSIKLVNKKTLEATCRKKDKKKVTSTIDLEKCISLGTDSSLVWKEG